MSAANVSPMKQTPMKQTMTMGLLPQPKLNYRTVLLAFALDVMLITGAVHLGVMKASSVVVVARMLVYTPLVTTATQPAKRPPAIKAYEPPVVAKLVIPRSSVVIRLALIEPPKVEIKAKVPVLTDASVSLPKLAPQVQVGAFATTKQAPTLPNSLPSERIQTGGFGDPNGVKGQGDGKSQVTISSLGSFDMPNGSGYGNGAGGAHGRAGTVAVSGFDSQADAPGSAATVHTLPHDTGKPVEILAHDRPDYTEEGRKLGIQGEVLLRVRFTASGQVSVLNVVQGLGHGLDEQAERAAEKIRFKPAENNGQQVDSVAIVHVIFELAS
jgi:TonB family protein